MPITTANPLFERFARVHVSDNHKHVLINFKPLGYWSDTAVTLRIDFTPCLPGHQEQSDCVCEDQNVTFAVNYEGGGQDFKLGMNHIATVENFHLAMTDALCIVNHVKARVKEGATFLELAEELIGIDLIIQDLKDIKGETLVFVDIGLERVAGYGIVFVNETWARKWIKRIRPTETPNLVFQEASQREENYWWFLLQKNIIQFNPYFSCWVKYQPNPVLD